MDGPPLKIYSGDRRSGRPTVTVVEFDDQERPLDHDHRHSDCFEWGYRGSGPTDLARMILADHLGWPPPIELYEPFRNEVVDELPHQRWVLSSTTLRSWLGGRLYRRDTVR